MSVGIYIKIAIDEKNSIFFAKFAYSEYTYTNLFLRPIRMHIRDRRFVFTSTILFIGSVLMVFAQVPNSYIANYTINEDYNKILEAFVQIEANSKVGGNLDA